MDPLAPVHAIENFLIRHGYCKTDGSTTPGLEPIFDEEQDDGNSLDDLDDSMVSRVGGTLNTGVQCGGTTLDTRVQWGGQLLIPEYSVGGQLLIPEYSVGDNS